MCGIFCITTKIKKDAPARVLEGLKGLEYRGYDSWGIATLSPDSDSTLIDKETGRLTDVETDLVGDVAIGHTRWATHGGVTKENAHPHTSCDGTIAVVHNGIIDNFQELKEKLLEEGHEFKSETDSEVIPHLLENHDFMTVFNMLSGLNAVIALNKNTKEIWAAKTGSPLVVGFGEDENYLASDASALLPLTKRVYFLHDSEAVRITADSVTLFDLETGNKKEIQTTTLEGDVSDAALIGYDHYLIKEVSEQPSVIRAIIQDGREDIERLARVIKRSYGTFFVGCGTAANAGLAGVYMFSRIARRHVNLATGSEFKYLIDFVTRGSLVIALSQSGETIDTIESVKAAKKNGATIASIVNVPQSTLFRLADTRMLLRAGPEKCVLATKSYMAKLSIMYLLAHELIGEYEKANEFLQEVALEVEDFISGARHEQVKALADKLSDKEDLYLIGRGPSFADALEGALKIKEVTYIHAEGFAGGELKHGSIALIEEGTPVVVFAPYDETYDGIISNAMEVKARGAYVIGISPKNHDVFDEHIKVKDIMHASNLVNIVPMQLLSYYMALNRGCDPDKPRNLAKSVTVR